MKQNQGTASSRKTHFKTRHISTSRCADERHLTFVHSQMKTTTTRLARSGRLRPRRVRPANLEGNQIWDYFRLGDDPTTTPEIRHSFDPSRLSLRRQASRRFLPVSRLIGSKPVMSRLTGKPEIWRRTARYFRVSDDSGNSPELESRLFLES
jgi:hypothetical protein